MCAKNMQQMTTIPWMYTLLLTFLKIFGHNCGSIPNRRIISFSCSGLNCFHKTDYSNNPKENIQKCQIT